MHQQEEIQPELLEVTGEGSGEEADVEGPVEEVAEEATGPEVAAGTAKNGSPALN